nr:unnamed protein product [Callosobruchus chinensis]
MIVWKTKRKLVKAFKFNFIYYDLNVKGRKIYNSYFKQEIWNPILCHVTSPHRKKSWAGLRFSDEEEAELLKFLQKLDDVFYGMTRLEFLQLAGEFAKRKGKTGRFTEGVAGKGWYKNFMLRIPTVTLRTSEPTSLARVKGFNRVAVGRFYDLLEEKYFEIEVNVFQKAHPGSINQFDVAKLFSAAYLKGASQGNATDMP